MDRPHHTIKGINAAIAARGIDAELVRGKGYFYLVGPDVEWAFSTSINVFRLNHLSGDQWLAAIDAIVADSAARKPKEN